MKYTFIRVFTLAKKKAKEYTRVTVKKYNPYHGADGKFTTASGAGGSAAGGAETQKPKSGKKKYLPYSKARDKINGAKLQDGTQTKLPRNIHRHIYKRHREILKNKLFQEIVNELPKTKDMRITLDKDLKEAKCYVIESKGKKYGVFTKREVKDGVREIMTIYRIGKTFEKIQEDRWGQYHEQRAKNNIDL